MSKRSNVSRSTKRGSVVGIIVLFTFLASVKAVSTTTKYYEINELSTQEVAQASRSSKTRSLRASETTYDGNTTEDGERAITDAAKNVKSWLHSTKLGQKFSPRYDERKTAEAVSLIVSNKATFDTLRDHNIRRKHLWRAMNMDRRTEIAYAKTDLLNQLILDFEWIMQYSKYLKEKKMLKWPRAFK